MTPAEALVLIRQASQTLVTEHARRRMRERQVTMMDIIELIDRVACVADGDEWLFDGADREGDPLRVVVALEEILGDGHRRIVVTVRDV